MIISEEKVLPLYVMHEDGTMTHHEVRGDGVYSVRQTVVSLLPLFERNLPGMMMDYTEDAPLFFKKDKPE